MRNSVNIVSKFLLLALIGTMSFPETSIADPTYGFLGLSPSDMESQKPSLTFGLAGNEWIGSASIIFNSEYTDSDFVDMPIPHTDYTDLGDKRVNNTYGLEAKKLYGFGNQKFSLFVGGGLYFGTKANIVQSNVTSWKWKQSEKSISQIGLEAGFLYGESGNTKIGLSFHNLKGVSIYLQTGIIN